MSKVIAVRLEDDVLEDIDRARDRSGLTRAAVLKEALVLWLEERAYRGALHCDKDGYSRQPVRADEFRPVLRAQIWPKATAL